MTCLSIAFTEAHGCKYDIVLEYNKHECEKLLLDLVIKQNNKKFSIIIILINTDLFILWEEIKCCKYARNVYTGFELIVIAILL